MRLNFPRAILLFFIAYIMVTVLASATTETYASFYNTPPPLPGVTVLKSVAFVATVPYHVLIMLIIWPVFAWIYFKKPRQNASQQVAETRALAFIWLVAAIIVDYVGFVLIRHPLSLTPHEFYIDYQPWISLIYVAIFLSPWICFSLSRMSAKR